jgi:hypothetical protein
MNDWIEATLTMRPLVERSTLRKGMRDVEHAIEVHRHDVLPILDYGIRIGGKRVAPIDAGIVDEDRDLADRLRYPVTKTVADEQCG